MSFEHMGRRPRQDPSGRWSAARPCWPLVAVCALLSACASKASYRTLPAPPGAVEGLSARIYLIGDAGLDSPGRDAVLADLRTDLRRHVDEHPSVPALVVFLGDNIYDVGARVEFREEDLEKLAAQVRAVVAAPTVRGVFLPGNHDWGKGASDPAGKTAIQVQQEWIAELEGAGDVGFLPADECPGPETLDVGDAAHVVFMDTEWLLRRPEGCGGADAFYQALTEELRRLRDGRVILVAHHPMVTGGPHGGNVGLLHQVPVVYYLAAKSGLSVQDLSSGRYSTMLDRLREAIAASGTRPLAMAAGHDHSLQVIRMDDADEPLYQLVSGSASKSSHVGRLRGTRFATSAHGYMRLDFNGTETRLVTLALEGPGNDPDAEVRPVFACHLSVNQARTCAEASLSEDSR